MQITRNSDKNQFETIVNGELAIAQYEMKGTQMTITHVIVPKPIEGQGVASALCQFAIETARAENLKIVPRCPFMSAYFRRHPENNDVLSA